MLSREGTIVRMPTSYRPPPTLARVLPSAKRIVTWLLLRLVPPVHDGHETLTPADVRLNVTVLPATPLIVFPPALRLNAPPPLASALVVTTEEETSDCRLTTSVMASAAGLTVVPE